MSEHPTSNRRDQAVPPSIAGDDRRSRLLAAGLDLFTERGFHGTTVADLCARADVSPRDFEQEFGSRESLVVALHDDVNNRALAAVIFALDGVDPNDVPKRISRATHAYLGVMTTDRRWAQIAILESVGISPAAEEHRRIAIDRFAALMEAEAQRLAADGVIPQRDFHLTAVAMTGAVYGLINTWTADVDWDVEVDKIVAEVTRLIVLALGYEG